MPEISAYESVFLILNNNGKLRILLDRDTHAQRCTCDIKMPDCKSCGCVFTWDDNVCACECFDEPSGGYTKGNFGKLKLTKESIVNVTFRNMPLVHAGNILQRVLGDAIYIPAKNPYVKINLKVKRKKISAIVKKLGLVTKSQLPSKK